MLCASKLRQDNYVFKQGNLVTIAAANSPAAAWLLVAMPLSFLTAKNSNTESFSKAAKKRKLLPSVTLYQVRAKKPL